MMRITLIKELVQFKNEIATYSTYTNQAYIATSPSTSSSTSLATSLATSLCHVTLPRRFATSLCHVVPMLEIPEMRSVHQIKSQNFPNRAADVGMVLGSLAKQDLNRASRGDTGSLH